MSKKATIIAVVNQKGGTGKTTTTENLGVGLALEGKKVLLVDTDPQASLTVSLGNPCPDDLSPYLPAKGLEQLLGTINKVKRQINPKLRIEGILLTMVDSRTNYSKDISNLIRESYGGKLKVYKTDIPRSVRAEEISAEGTSIFKHDPKGKVAEAYKILTKEVLNNAEKRRKHQLEGVR